jgi:hypothetical protein
MQGLLASPPFGWRTGKVRFSRRYLELVPSRFVKFDQAHGAFRGHDLTIERNMNGHRFGFPKKAASTSVEGRR